MPHPVLKSESDVDGSLSDIVERYEEAREIEPVPWLVSLRLDQPRKNLSCLSRSQQLVKRIVDIFGALAILILASPIMILAAVLVKCTSRGPVIFRQTRVGLNLRTQPADRRSDTTRSEDVSDASETAAQSTDERRSADGDRRRVPAHGRQFTLYKFRTMFIDAEKHGAQLATERDPRITAVGRVLRRTRIDELPQVINVLRGEMSLVGPRPERPEFIDTLSLTIPNYLNRLGLRPGISGLAQIINGYDTDEESVRRKVCLDVLYLQNCCLWNDVMILLRTVWVVISGKGAR